MTGELQIQMRELMLELRRLRAKAEKHDIYSTGYGSKSWREIHPLLKDVEDRWEYFVYLHGLDMAEEILAARAS